MAPPERTQGRNGPIIKHVAPPRELEVTEDERCHLLPGDTVRPDGATSDFIVCRVECRGGAWMVAPEPFYGQWYYAKYLTRSAAMPSKNCWRCGGMGPRYLNADDTHGCHVCSGPTPSAVVSGWYGAPVTPSSKPYPGCEKCRDSDLGPGFLPSDWPCSCPAGREYFVQESGES